MNNDSIITIMHMPISCSALIDIKIGEPVQSLVNGFKQLLTIINDVGITEVILFKKYGSV